MPATPSADPPLAVYLAVRDVPCPRCGYNLRGLASDRCPECDQPLVLTLSPADPPMAAYALAVAGLAACGAALALLLVGVVYLSVVEGGFPRGEAMVVLLWAPAAVVALDAALVAAALRPRRRRWFQARSRGGRWAVALACWGASLAVFMAWLTLLFQGL